MYPNKQIEIRKTSQVLNHKSSKRYKLPLDELQVDEFFEVQRPEGEEFLERKKRYLTLANVRSHITYYTKTEEGRGKEFICQLVVADSESEYAGKNIVMCTRIK